MKIITVKDIRRLRELMKRYSIPPEPCGCIKYETGITLTCEEHSVPLTKEQIERAKKNLEAIGLTI